MARSIVAAVQRIKAEVAHWLTPEAIREVCHAVGHTWRERVLDPVTTVHLFLLQILHGNTACAHVPRLGPTLSMRSAEPRSTKPRRRPTASRSRACGRTEALNGKARTITRRPYSAELLVLIALRELCRSGIALQPITRPPGSEPP